MIKASENYYVSPQINEEDLDYIKMRDSVW